MSNYISIPYLSSVLRNKCPRCRKGNLFTTKSAYKLKSTLEMNKSCPVCNQKTEIEPGFYYGTSYVSYALAVAFVVSVFVAWYVLIGFSINDDRVFWCMGTAIVGLILIQPFLMRLSRTLWLSWFVKYDKNWGAVIENTTT
ncbi:MAG: DUF983 domain-containing protein [Chitinophagaceae bacterium]|nr:DUF983 domain-containing protein [Chitinophagaceae bacterium]